MLSGKYNILYNRLKGKIDRKRIFHDPLHTLAFGTDASFYRLVPEIAVRAMDETEVSTILKECRNLNIPVTFRAAGTSLSGQAVTDSLLLIAADNWNRYRINADGSEITLQPGLTGGRVNSLLAPYGRKIGPDPASINAAMIGGIAANNASGMCCGTASNSYKTVSGIRIILADGTVLDTADDLSRQSFLHSHADMVSEIAALADTARKNPELAAKIRKKYKMKNTTGYSLNALVDFTDPIDIIEHLMIGSEGTLAFISEIHFKTVPEYPCRASSLITFPDIENACVAVKYLKHSPVIAVELIDRAGLRSVENESGMPGYLSQLGSSVCALLVETVAQSHTELHSNIDRVVNALEAVPTERAIEFTDNPSEYEVLWKIRKGLFPSVGAMRRAGTSVIIEDVAFPVEHLAEATTDLRGILEKYGYTEAVIFGHSLEGNLHFVFTQDFGSEAEIERYRNLMNEVCDLVVRKYDGSLKAEHGTGRNMAPFVELEWGKDAYILMKEIKRIFDPEGILNPGVILNDDSKIHLRNLKPMPQSSSITDKCTECGFCESSCVSAGLTLTPRQRIAVHREMVMLRGNGREPHIAAALAKGFSYAVMDTCAADGLCAMNCPVKIDTGKLIKELRHQQNADNERFPLWIANHMAAVTSVARITFSVISFFHLLLGTRIMNVISSGLSLMSFRNIPRWNEFMPSGAKRIDTSQPPSPGDPLKVVYFPSCINRSMGVSRDHKSELQLTEKTVILLRKAGYEAIFPDDMDNLCCGMAFSSKGYNQAGERKSRELEAALLRASNNGEYPVLCDMSPCLFTMRENMKPPLRLYEPVEFIMEFLMPRLSVTPLDETITVFPVCSTKKMGLDGKLVQLAGLCAKNVVVPESNCCGFAGDRGFTQPELNRNGLKDLKAQLQEAGYGYSTSRTCEIGLGVNTGISYKSIIYLVDRVSASRT